MLVLGAFRILLLLHSPVVSLLFLQYQFLRPLVHDPAFPDSHDSFLSDEGRLCLGFFLKWRLIVAFPCDCKSSLTLYEVLVINVEEFGKLPQYNDNHYRGKDSEDKTHNKENQNEH